MGSLSYVHAGILCLVMLLAGCGGDSGSLLSLADRKKNTTQADTEAPSPPAIIVPNVVSSSQINLSWTLSTDNVGVAGYKIYRGGIYVKTVTSNPISDASLTPETVYCYSVSAIDAANNESSHDMLACAITGTVNGVRRVPDTGQTTTYTVTPGEDADYLTNSPTYSDIGNGTIVDNVTGLMWQKQDDATKRTWPDASTYCDALTLGGNSDWRLPTDFELQTIVDYGGRSPAVDPTFFPGTQSDFYWSSIVSAASVTPVAETVFFAAGQAFGFQSDAFGYSYFERCVRGSNAFTNDFFDNGNGTVTDRVTELIWQKQDGGAPRTWEQALAYCNALNLGEFSDWRLPNIKELKSITDMTTHDPAINGSSFPGSQSAPYWSSTTNAWNAAFAWYVDFGYGVVLNDDKTKSYAVRCVR